MHLKILTSARHTRQLLRPRWDDGPRTLPLGCDCSHTSSLKPPPDILIIVTHRLHLVVRSEYELFLVSLRTEDGSLRLKS